MVAVILHTDALRKYIYNSTSLLASSRSVFEAEPKPMALNSLDYLTLELLLLEPFEPDTRRQRRAAASLRYDESGTYAL